jgi:hypothetical protein
VVHHVSQDTAANLEISGVPRHRLHLHVNIGTPVHLLAIANIDPAAGLCKGEHAIVMALLKCTVAVRLLHPLHPDHTNLVLSCSNFDFPVKNLPVTICGHQFPVSVAFTSTTHSIQGANMYLFGVLQC